MDTPLIQDILILRHIMGNQDTVLGRSLKVIETANTGRETGPQQKGQVPKTIGESDHLIVLRDGRAVHMGKGVTVMCNRQRQPVRDT